MEGSSADTLTTAGLAATSGYSPQQVRDLERLGVLPPATRSANNYRHFGPRHVTALRAYRALAEAVGSVAARSTLRTVRTTPPDEAAAHVNALHTDLARLRTQVLDALGALDAIRGEPIEPESADDAMTITQLAGALGVRTSTLRFWESEGLLIPDRATSTVPTSTAPPSTAPAPTVPTPPARRYPVRAVRDARIVTALRTASYPVPAVRAAMESLRRLEHRPGNGRELEPRDALQQRLDDIGHRTVALLRAGADIAALLDAPAPPASVQNTRGSMQDTRG